MVRREWRPGVMHAVIFIGFLSLLLRKLHLIAIGFDESASFPQNASLPVISTITWVPTVATKPAAMPSPTSVSTDQRALGRVAAQLAPPRSLAAPALPAAPEVTSIGSTHGK